MVNPFWNLMLNLYKDSQDTNFLFFGENFFGQTPVPSRDTVFGGKFITKGQNFVGNFGNLILFWDFNF